MSCVQKINFCAKNKVFHETFFCLFYTGHKKYRFSAEQLCEQIECEDVTADIYFEIF